jgi:hypothetical protein
MNTFIDGPAEGKTLRFERAPKYLRAVIDPDGKVDVLNEPSDEPRPDEAIFAYVAVRNRGTAHINSRDARGRNTSGWTAMVEYRFIPDQPDDATLRDRALWCAWTEDRHAKGLDGGPGVKAVTP